MNTSCNTRFIQRRYMKKLNRIIFFLSLIYFPTISCLAQSYEAPKTHGPFKAKRNPNKRITISNDPLIKNSHWSNSNNPEDYLTYRCFTKTGEEGGKDQFTRREFIQRKTDKNPVMFYKHERNIAFTLGNQNQLILINDFFAVLGNQIMIKNLNNGQIHQIDKKSIRDYFHKLFPKSLNPFPAPAWDHAESEIRLWTLPIAIGFSADDSQVLIHMEN